MQPFCKFIATSTTAGFIFLHGIRAASVNAINASPEQLKSQLREPQLRESRLGVSSPEAKASIPSALSLQAQDFKAQDFKAQDLAPPIESLPNQAPSQETPSLAPSVESGTPEKPAQVPTRLDDLLANPDRLNKPTKPEEVQIQKIAPLTLQQAIALVQQNSRQLELARIQLDRSRAVLREAQAALFPTVGLQSSYSQDLAASGELSVDATRARANSQIPQAQAQLNQLLNQPAAADPLQRVVQRLSIQQAQGQLATAQGSLQNLDNFATRTFNGTLAVNYAIFTSGQRPAIVKSASEQVRVSELEVERVNEQVRLDVTQSYYDLQQADQQIQIQAAAVKEAAKSLSDAQALLGAALATRLDVLNAQVQLDNATQQLTQFQSQQAIARRFLAQLLSLPPSISVSAVDPIAITERWNLTLEESIVRAFKYRVELEQQLAQRRASQQQRQAAIAAQLPQLRAFVNYNLLDFQTDQPGEFVAQGFATGYTIGLSLQWTFFDGGITFARIAQQNANIRLAEVQFAQATEQVRFDVEQAYFNLQSNLQNVQVASASLDRAREALRIARLRFQAGVGIQLDVLNAETNLTRAQGNLLNAILGYNRALASLKRAVSSNTPVSRS